MNSRAHMANNQLDRLLFHQGGRCFFCEQTLPRTEASVEHLHAVSNGGSREDENCVVCCKSVKCPNGIHFATERAGQPNGIPPTEEIFTTVLTNLRQQENRKRPQSPKALTGYVQNLFKALPESQITGLIDRLQSSGKILLGENKVTYGF